MKGVVSISNKNENLRCENCGSTEYHLEIGYYNMKHYSEGKLVDEYDSETEIRAFCDKCSQEMDVV